MFDTDLINIPQDPPTWYADGERMWREEEEEAEVAIQKRVDFFARESRDCE